MSILPIIGIIGGIVDKLIPDPSEKMKLHLELARLADAENARASQEALAQSEVNKIEAGHRSVFVAGWRPAIGWGCGLALVYNTLLAPLFELGVADLGFLQTVLLAMLGISVSRTVEKVKGVTNDVLPIRAPSAAPVLPVKPRKKILGIKWPF
jgi:hypothetical protein